MKTVAGPVPAEDRRDRPYCERRDAAHKSALQHAGHTIVDILPSRERARLIGANVSRFAIVVVTVAVAVARRHLIHGSRAPTGIQSATVRYRGPSPQMAVAELIIIYWLAGTAQAPGAPPTDACHLAKGVDGTTRTGCRRSSTGIEPHAPGAVAHSPKITAAASLLPIESVQDWGRTYIERFDDEPVRTPTACDGVLSCVSCISCLSWLFLPSFIRVLF